MVNKQMLCERCLKVIEDRLDDEDWKVMVALYRSGPQNRDRIISRTHLSTYRVRESITRLYGACLVDISRFGNGTIMRLTPTGETLCRIFENQRTNEHRRTKDEKT